MTNLQGKLAEVTFSLNKKDHSTISKIFFLLYDTDSITWELMYKASQWETRRQTALQKSVLVGKETSDVISLHHVIKLARSCVLRIGRASSAARYLA